MSSIKQVKTRHDSEGFRVHYENPAGRFHKALKRGKLLAIFFF
ncbi:hypothetical protein [Candidatus Arsenophonus triatominarum]|nr:hypothetical protein [Candidatus Arsenophonus triatominarum]